MRLLILAGEVESSGLHRVNRLHVVLFEDVIGHIVLSVESRERYSRKLKPVLSLPLVTTSTTVVALVFLTVAVLLVLLLLALLPTVVRILLVIIVVIFDLNDDILEDGIVVLAAAHAVVSLRHASALDQLMTLFLLTASLVVVAHNNPIALLVIAVDSVALPELGVYALDVLGAALGRDHPIIELVILNMMACQQLPKDVPVVLVGRAVRKIQLCHALNEDHELV